MAVNLNELRQENSFHLFESMLAGFVINAAYARWPKGYPILLLGDLCAGIANGVRHGLHIPGFMVKRLLQCRMNKSRQKWWSAIGNL